LTNEAHGRVRGWINSIEESNMAQKIQTKTEKSVAAILERELDSLISEWKRRVSLVPSLTDILLNDADRAGHLPALFNEMLCRLRGSRDAELVSIAAAAHGRLRFAQGYSVGMLVEESRILEVTTFSTLQRHQGELDRKQVLPDVTIIADEADRQLEETVVGFIAARSAAEPLSYLRRSGARLEVNDQAKWDSFG
jgi:hypothetical protein